MENNNEKLHWRNDIPRHGLGDLIKRVNHYAIAVSDVKASLHFYKDIIGLQTIRRPNFDRHGAWLTMGNIELHLVKGIPAVHKGDNLIVSHISLETYNVKEALLRLKKMGIPYAQNISVPTGDESGIITQYFIRDPDGYYVEICNCEILTNFCLSEDENEKIEYNESVQNINPTSIIKMALIANELSHSTKSLEDLVLPEVHWAVTPDPRKLQNLLSRTKIYGDPMQGETRDSISRALIEANNHVPLATRIIRARKGSKIVFIPPAFYLKGKEEKYQPALIERDLPKSKQVDQPTVQFSTLKNKNELMRQRALELIQKLDLERNGSLGIEELRNHIRSICPGINEGTLQHMVDMVDKNHDGTVSVEGVIDLIRTRESDLQVQAFFHLLDDDNNGKITLPELSKALALIGVDVTDEQVEEIFIEGDLDGDGTLDCQELGKLLRSCSSISWLRK